MKILYYLEKINGNNLKSRNNRLIIVKGNKIKSLKGKFIYQKILFLLQYLSDFSGINHLSYRYLRKEWGPHSTELAFDMNFLKEEGFVHFEGEDIIIANKKKIEYYFQKRGIDLKLSAEEGKVIFKMEEIINIELKDDYRIELATSMLFLVKQGFILKKEIFNELEKWKPGVFNDLEKENIWNLLYLNKILYKVVLDISFLSNINTGIKNAHKYHKLISYIISYIFKDTFSNMEFEREVYNGRCYIDTVYTNIAQNGFFRHLPEKYKGISCNYIVLEAKNFTLDPGNREVDQLASRLNKKVSNFGILTCRNIKNEKLMLQRCQYHLDSNKYIIFLTDTNLQKLVKWKILGLGAEIHDFIDNKFKALVFRS